MENPTAIATNYHKIWVCMHQFHTVIMSSRDTAEIISIGSGNIHFINVTTCNIMNMIMLEIKLDKGNCNYSCSMDFMFPFN